MGHQVSAQCLDCGHPFTVDHGGGFLFRLLRCDQCGRTKSIGSDRLGQLHRRYLKGLPGSHGVASSPAGERTGEDTAVEPLSAAEYHRGIEALAGGCRCRGKYTLDAPPRCPKCRSTRLEEGKITVMYD